jgi:ferredoxin
MKIIVDYDLCESNGVCVKIAPEVFRLDDNDDLQHDESPPDELREKVDKAVMRCPRGALSIEE